MVQLIELMIRVIHLVERSKLIHRTLLARLVGLIHLVHRTDLVDLVDLLHGRTVVHATLDRSCSCVRCGNMLLVAAS